MTDDKIELRSEKIRTIIGEIPSRCVSYGIIVITIVISGLLAAAYFIPYPETIDAKIMIKNETQGTIAIPYKYINTVRKGMTVSIELEGFDRQRYGMTKGSIVSIRRRPKRTTEGNVFIGQVRINDSKCKIISGMTGSAYILAENGSILQKIMGHTISYL